MEYGESGDNRAELVKRPEETDQMVMGVGNDMEEADFFGLRGKEAFFLSRLILSTRPITESPLPP